MMKKLLSLIILFLFMSTLLLAQRVIEFQSPEAKIYIENYEPDSLLIIDGRTQSMFESGHLKNAVNINAFSENADQELTKYLDRKRILIYCTKSNRSRTIVNKLQLLDYAGEIVFVTDGITGWKNNDFELVVDSIDSEP
jgi:rhodanese-related sulfurtransferase